MPASMGKHITLPAPPSLSELRDRGPVALFIDLDGTLIELAETPDAIEVPTGLGGHLEELSAKLDGRLALVSGRSLENLAGHLGAVAIARAGSHGAARQGPDNRWLGDKPRGIPTEVAETIARFAEETGLVYEAKTHGCALHYRLVPHAGEATEEFMSALSERHELVVKRGKCVVELVQPGADKGGAVRAFMDDPSFAAAYPVFIGDDVTDEDGFAACNALGGIGILVGESRETHARYRLSNVDAVHKWLGLDAG